MSRKLKVRVGDRWYSVEVQDLTTNPVRVLVDGDPVEVDVEQLPSLEPPKPEGEASVESAPEVDASVKSAPEEAAEPPAPQTPVVPAPAAAAITVFRSPMPGVVISVAVKEGDQVVAGDDVCVLEAMKMEQVLRAERAGTVVAIHVSPGQQVSDGEPLVDVA